ncbi:nuclease-related domain-containing protein [Mesorhizobium sp. KR2-14]|uniref:nuclease-related domain-containing protein n=1 Tax=Mesorhizobium sp. KR2-14 TaxID=3156610 RepID=UPI0032B543B1
MTAKEISTTLDSLEKHLNEGIVNDAIENFSWPSLHAHLSDVGLDAGNFEHLLGLIRRGSDLIIKRPQPNREAARDTFLAKLKAFVVETAGEDRCGLLRGELQTMMLLESGYREVLAALEIAPSANMLPEMRLASVLSRAAANFRELDRRMANEQRSRKHMPIQSFRIPLENGASAPPDGILSVIVNVATATLMMEAHQNRWVGKDKRFELPTLPVVSEDELVTAGPVEALAVFWRRWERLDQRYRYLGNQVVEFTGEDLPDWAPAGVTRVIRQSGMSETETADFLANERLNARLVQTYMEMTLQTNMQDKASGIAGPLNLLPEAYTSAEEAHAAVSLCEILGYQITHDHERPGGLRLVEWLRGYAALSCLVRERYDAQGVGGLLVVIPRGELVPLLETLGLKNGTADVFVDQAMLRTSSRDLFDQPLVRLQGGFVLVFGPALLGADPARTTLSSLGSLEIQLERKGKAFERDMLEFFREQDLPAHTFKTKRDGEEYEFDVIVPWGDFVFLFECKNKMLSGHNPVQAFRFDQGLRSAIHQVNRQADFLRANPDVLLDRAEIDLAGKTLVPCVLNSLPFALPGPVDGVYVTDASGLKRFFQGRHVHAIVPHHLGKGRTLAHRTALKSLWTGERPTPQDLLRNLDEPVALTITGAHLTTAATCFPLGGGTVVEVEEFSRTEANTESVAALFGADPVIARRGIDAVAKQVREAKARSEKKMLRDQDRSWRKKRTKAR